MDATEVRDPYEVLKLPNGADSTEQEIKKASSPLLFVLAGCRPTLYRAMTPEANCQPP